MIYELLKSNKQVSIKKYRGIKNRSLYFLYLKETDLYKQYKTYLYNQGFVITDIFIYKTCIKFIYYRGYNPYFKPRYYVNNIQIGMIKQKENGLI